VGLKDLFFIVVFYLYFFWSLGEELHGFVLRVDFSSGVDKTS
jgi:hypothetical protein